MWKFKFEAPAGSRVMKQGFIWITCYPTLKESQVVAPNYNEKLGRWVYDSTWTSTASGECIKSFKAFKKYLRKHPELQIEGVDVVLVNKYYNDSSNKHGFNIIANWIEQ